MCPRQTDRQTDRMLVLSDWRTEGSVSDSGQCSSEYTKSLLYSRLFCAFYFRVPCQFTPLLNLRPPISYLTPFDRLYYVTSSPYL